MPDQEARPPAHPGPVGQNVRLIEQKAEHVGEAASLDDEATVHIALAQRKLGIGEDSALGFVSKETDGERITRAVAAGEGFAARRRDGHSAAANEFIQGEM